MVSGLMIEMKLYQYMNRCFINLLKAKVNNKTNTKYSNLIIIKSHFDILIVYQDLVKQLLYLTQLYDIWQSFYTNTYLIPYSIMKWVCIWLENSKLIASLSFLEVINWTTLCNNSITGYWTWLRPNLCMYMKLMTLSGFILNMKCNGWKSGNFLLWLI